MDQFRQLKKLEIMPSINPSCPIHYNGIFITGCANYGCWDGNNFWIGANDKIHKIFTGPFNSLVTTGYNGFSVAGADGGNPIQLAFDGSYIWVGDYDSRATWFKFDPTLQTTIASGRLYPLGPDMGGIQGVHWADDKLWFGAPNNVIRFNITSNSVELIVSGQNNVNGLSHYTDDTGQKYILAACSDFWSKINADTGSYTTYDNLDHAIGYRICNDGTYCYIAYFSDPGRVRKFLLSTGEFIATWNVGSLLNAINFDGLYIWTVGDDWVMSITDTNGNFICNTSNGKADILFGGGFAWSVAWGAPFFSETVYRTRLTTYTQIISGMTYGYNLKLYNDNEYENLVIPVYEAGLGFFVSGIPAGRYVLDYNGYVAAKMDLLSGLSADKSLNII